jgi:hypothetical protein
MILVQRIFLYVSVSENPFSYRATPNLTTLELLKSNENGNVHRINIWCQTKKGNTGNRN